MFWFIQIKMPKLKDLKLEDITHQKLLSRILDIFINAKNFYNEYTDSDKKQYKEIRNLITEQGKDYTTGHMVIWVDKEN